MVSDDSQTMSDLQKKWAKTKISTAMHTMAPPPLPELGESDEDRFGAGSVPNTPQDDDSSSASSMSSTGTVIPSPGRALFARPQGFPGRSLDPIPWTTYFERELFLPAPDGSVAYHAYLTSPAPSSGPGKPPGPLFVTHHGAGSSGLSFAVLSAEIRKRLPSAGILSLDARGHGLTTTTRGEEAGSADAPAPAEDLTLATLAADLLAILRLTQSAMHWPALPPLLLVGHSLGGAVVTEFASVLLPSLSRQPPASTPAPPSTTTPISIATGATKATLPRRSPPAAAPAAPAAPAGTDPGLPSPPPPPAAAPPPSSPSPPATDTIDLLGYAVLDVVEGSALDALQSMHAYLATRPGGFETLRDGVEWHVRSRTVRNAVSARASVPGLLVCRAPSSSDDDDEGGKGKGGNKPWRWRTDLARTQPFWEGWFGGLSGKFLRGRGGKMLLLAGTDRLDTELTIGQMQGKYALQVFPEAGHFIHEDLPEKTAVALVDFHRRNDRGALVLPPKVSELLAQGKKV